MGKITSELVARLIDGVTKPAAGIARAIGGIGRAQNAVNSRAGFGVRLADAAANVERRMDRARMGMLDTVGISYVLARALKAPTDAAIEFQSQLEDIGQKANIPQEKLAGLGRSIQKVARDTNNATTEMAKAVDSMLGKGASEDVALKLANPVGKAAVAYRASTEDLANAAWAAVDNLKVPTDQVMAAIDAMAVSGKEGAFELRDMAQYFPALGASYQRFGQKGVSAVADLAAALQVVRKGTGDSATAFTNLQNVMQKIYAPATRKNFKKLGINLEKEMKKSLKKGMTPIEAIAEITNKALKGDLSKLGNLFEDAQVQAGLTSIIQNMEEYRRIRAEAMKSSGTTEADYERRIKTAAGATLRWSAAIENLKLAIGTALLPGLVDLIDKLTPIINRITEWTEANPELTSQIVQATTALVGLRLAMSVLKFGGLWMFAGGLRAAGKAASVLSFAGRPLVGFFQTLALRARLAAGTTGKLPGLFSRMGDALMVAGRGLGRIPLGALRSLAGVLSRVSLPAAAIATAGKLIYDNWQGLKNFFGSFGTEFMAGLGDLGPAVEKIKGWFSPLQGIFDGLKAAGTGIVDTLGQFAALKDLFTMKWEIADPATMGQWGATAGKAAGEISRAVISALSNLPASMANALSQIGSTIYNAFANIDVSGAALEIARNFGNSLVSGIQNLAGAVADSIKGLFSGIGGVTVPVNINNKGAGGGGNDGAAAAGAAVGGMAGPPKRARGGPVQKDRAYWVGEEKPEVFVPRQSGNVVPLRKPTPMSGGRAKKTAGMTYSPSYHIGNVTGVADLQAELAKHDARARAQFEHYMAGIYSDEATA